MSLGVVSCIDDNYDLSDIDTTTELKANNLTIPVNLKEIYLDQIIDVDGSNPDAVIKIKEINGQKIFFFSKDGDFEASPKTIDKVDAPEPEHIESSSIQIFSSDETSSYKEYDVTEFHTDFTYNIGRNGNPKVDPAIKSIMDVTVDTEKQLTISLRFCSENIATKSSRIELDNLVVTVPECMIAHYGEYVSQNGKITIPHLESTSDIISIDILVDFIDFVTDDEPNGKEVIDGMFDFTEQVGVASADYRVYPSSAYTVADLPAEITFVTNYELSSFAVSMFSGQFDYAIDFDDVNPFDLTDLPKFLQGEETDIILADPALTLTLNSPVAEYGLECVSGLTLTALRSDSENNVTASLEQFTVEPNIINQLHILAPTENVLDYLDIPEGSTYYFTEFTQLSNILAGKGLPNSVTVSFESVSNPSPRVIGTAKNFPLGTSLNQVHGVYEFASPLALSNGSKIVYTKTEDGWNDEDVDAITISSLKVRANVTSEIPAAAVITVRPIDVNGNLIPITNSETAYATLPVLAQDYPIELELLGDIRHLDGIYIEAVVDDFDGSNLSPDYTLKITDLKATVTGNYTKKL